ncbi:MAG TPA: DedA family protein [Flexivirga sp.]|uniref:DedA family protein n=1 Tax=Flexivirga sp. TaxID=1962927 RepID=UPI002CF76D61|nr:DedA family protein [Flexivirga sp.]HWC24806.1 DedA family protein [Flexivirga sp.]
MSLAVLFLLIVADGVIPPVPSEAVLLAHVPAAAAGGWPALLGLGVLAAVAAMLGDAITYLLGRRIGTNRFAWQRRPWIARLLERTGAALDRQGVPLIVSARMLPGWRVAITFLAGASRLPMRRFLVASALGSTLWAAYLIGIGATVGALTGAGPLVVAAISLVTMVVLGQVVRWVRTRLPADRRPKSTGKAADPVISGRRLSGKERLDRSHRVPEVRRGGVDQLVMTAAGQHLQ